MGRGAGGKGECAEAFDLDEALIGLAEIASCDAHIDPGSEKELGNGCFECGDVTNESGPRELYSRCTYANGAAVREEAGVRAAEAAESAGGAGDADERKIGDAVVGEAVAEQCLVNGIGPADAEDSEMRAGVGAGDDNGGMSFHVVDRLIVEEWGSRTRCLAQGKGDRTRTGELDLDDVVVEVDVGQACDLTGVCSDGGSGSSEQNLIVDIAVGVTDVGSDLYARARDFAGRGDAEERG